MLALLFLIQWQGPGVKGGSAVQPKVCICSVGVGMSHLDIHTGMSAGRKLEEWGMLEGRQWAPTQPWGCQLWHPAAPTGHPAAQRGMGGLLRPREGLCSSGRRVIWLWQPGAAWLAYSDMMICSQFQGTSSQKRFCMLIPSALISQASGCWLPSCRAPSRSNLCCTDKRG